MQSRVLSSTALCTAALHSLSTTTSRPTFPTDFSLSLYHTSTSNSFESSDSVSSDTFHSFTSTTTFLTAFTPQYLSVRGTLSASLQQVRDPILTVDATSSRLPVTRLFAVSFFFSSLLHRQFQLFSGRRNPGRSILSNNRGSSNSDNWLCCRPTTLPSVHHLHQASLTDRSISSPAASWF